MRLSRLSKKRPKLHGESAEPRQVGFDCSCGPAQACTRLNSSAPRGRFSRHMNDLRGRLLTRVSWIWRSFSFFHSRMLILGPYHSTTRLSRLPASCRGTLAVRKRTFEPNVGGNCQVPIPSIPGDVHHLCDFRLERQRSSLINGTPSVQPVQIEKRDFSSVRFLFV